MRCVTVLRHGLIVLPLLRAGVTAAAFEDVPPQVREVAGSASEAEAPVEAEAIEADGTAEASLPGSWTIHGYLTQAYARTDGNQIFGIPGEGTTDYRNAAAQLQYVSGRRRLALQVSHERLGRQTADTPDLALDWAFYEHRFKHLTVKVGRVQIPMGIYNEIRDVGTVLPFFRPARNLYGEGDYASETVDGVVLTRAFELGPWGVDVSTFYGGWDVLETQRDAQAVARVDNGLGGQVWLRTPVPGLRLGAHLSRQTLSGGLNRPADEPREGILYRHFSVDGTFDRALIRAEYVLETARTNQWDAYSVEGGLRVAPRTMVLVQAEAAWLEFPGYARRFDRTYGVGLNHELTPGVLLKGEYRWNRGYLTQDPLPQIFGEAQSTRYAILSLAASF